MLNSRFLPSLLHMKFKVKVKLLSRVRLFATPWTVAHQASPSMGFSRQEYWSGVPFPSPGDFPNSGIEGNGSPLRYSCLENPMDGGAWWATVHGFAESDTIEQLPRTAGRRFTVQATRKAVKNHNL